MFDPTCVELESVSHVAHISTAKRVIEDYSLRADLVYDASILNSERIRVVWLSPNDWAYGFRYGNIRFTLGWAKLVEGKRYYWVEAMRQYNPTACRILVTDTDYSESLPLYDPRVGDGPWWIDGEGNHWWQGRLCLEIMFEGNIQLDEVMKLDFVEHHRNLCNVGAAYCEYRGVEGSVAGAEFIAWVLSSGNADRVAQFSEDFAGATTRLLRRCMKVDVTGPGMSADDPRAEATVRAFLGVLYGHESNAKLLANLFDSNASLVTAVERVIVNDFPNGPELID